MKKFGLDLRKTKKLKSQSLCNTSKINLTEIIVCT